MKCSRGRVSVAFVGLLVAVIAAAPSAPAEARAGQVTVGHRGVAAARVVRSGRGDRPPHPFRDLLRAPRCAREPFRLATSVRTLMTASYPHSRRTAL